MCESPVNKSVIVFGHNTISVKFKIKKPHITDRFFSLEKEAPRPKYR